MFSPTLEYNCCPCSRTYDYGTLGLLMSLSPSAFHLSLHLLYQCSMAFGFRRKISFSSIASYVAKIQSTFRYFSIITGFKWWWVVN